MTSQLVRLTRAFAVLTTLVLLPATATAQWTVFDPTNYYQALARYTQLQKQYWTLQQQYQLAQQEYLHWMRQAQRLPADRMASRYRVYEVPWRTHTTQFEYARPYLTGLNAGDITGGQYFAAVDRLDQMRDVLPRVPPDLRRRLETEYATIELADSVASMGVHQVGAIRVNGQRLLSAVQAMEDDAVTSQAEYHTETALLNKINAAAVLNLRIGERTSQFMMHTLEQLLVENKRQRDAESQVMNARIHQWRYGTRYGEDLFKRTAEMLDRWRQP